MWIRNRYKPEEKYQIAGHKYIDGKLCFLVFREEVDDWRYVLASMYVPVKEEEQTFDI